MDAVIFLRQSSVSLRSTAPFKRRLSLAFTLIKGLDKLQFADIIICGCDLCIRLQVNQIHIDILLTRTRKARTYSTDFIGCCRQLVFLYLKGLRYNQHLYCNICLMLLNVLWASVGLLFHNGNIAAVKYLEFYQYLFVLSRVLLLKLLAV